MLRSVYWVKLESTDIFKNQNYSNGVVIGDDYMTPPAEDKREVHCVMELDLERLL